MIRSAFRYPGSKEKIADHVQKWFPPRVNYAYLNRELSCYCEPFIGCGAMATGILHAFPDKTRIVFADKDYGIVCLWRAVLDTPGKLAQMLLNFTPTVEQFKRFKELDGDRNSSPLEIGFRKFALHQMSFSGLGAKAGGPIGGKKQRSDYAVDCRFRPERHAKVISQQHKALKRFASVEVIEGDFSQALDRVPSDGFVYLDPPYYLKGGELYVHNMTPDDHARLAGLLKAGAFEWVLSYDDHPEVRAMYSGWADIHEFQMTATIDSKKGAGARRKNNELVITKREQE
jgi:DNA adenine methylase